MSNNVFSVMEDIKDRLPELAEYSVSETTLSRSSSPSRRRKSAWSS
jgi:hypothetical protein